MKKLPQAPVKRHKQPQKQARLIHIVREHDFENKSFSEIANDLECSVGNISVLYRTWHKWALHQIAKAPDTANDLQSSMLEAQDPKKPSHDRQTPKNPAQIIEIVRRHDFENTTLTQIATEIGYSKMALSYMYRKWRPWALQHIADAPDTPNKLRILALATKNSKPPKNRQRVSHDKTIFRIKGTIDSITNSSDLTRVTIVCNNGSRINGTWIDKFYQTHVIATDKATRAHINTNFMKGHRVMATGNIQQYSSEQNGQTIYRVDLITNKMSRLTLKKVSAPAQPSAN